MVLVGKVNGDLVRLVGPAGGARRRALGLDGQTLAGPTDLSRTGTGGHGDRGESRAPWRC